MESTCSICLQDIQEKETIKTLSCGHTFHYTCFRDMIYHSVNSAFLECPLCRNHNTDVSKPSQDIETNIRILCTNSKRCMCETKKGTRCRNTRQLLNYGYCHLHNKNILDKLYYPLMERYMYMIICHKNKFKTKLLLLDIAKKIMIKYCEPSSHIEDILQYFYQYISLSPISSCQDYQRMYGYYELEKQPENWIDECLKRKVII